jgi:Fe-S cluster assembly protein SufD
MRHLVNSFTADAAQALPGPDWLRARRGAAFQRFAAAELPTEQEEVWRYSRISELDLSDFRPVVDDGGDGSHEIPEPLRPLVDAVGARAALVLVVDGRIVSVELDEGLAAKGVVVGSLADLPEGDAVLGTVSGPNDVFGNLHAAFVRDPVVVHVPAGVAVERPVVVLQWMATEGAAVFPRTLPTCATSTCRTSGRGCGRSGTRRAAWRATPRCSRPWWRSAATTPESGPTRS